MLAKEGKKGEVDILGEMAQGTHSQEVLLCKTVPESIGQMLDMSAFHQWAPQQDWIGYPNYANY